MEKNCKLCNSKFILKRKDQIFCSKKCASKHSYYILHNKKLDKKMYQCLVCKKSYTPKLTTQKYCGEKCKKKDYRIINREKINKKKRESYNQNKEDINKKKREKRKEELNKIKAYCNFCNNEIKERNSKYINTLKFCSKLCHSRKRLENIKKDTNKYLILVLRNRTRLALNNFRKNKTSTYKKNNHLLDFLGCSTEELKKHLEKQFLKGMSWENYGDWHIDHIKPISKGNTEEEIYILNHYTNLQPLWAVDNLKKGNRF